MTTLSEREREALLVIDVQQGVFADAHDRDAIVGRISALVDRARASATPVVWVRHSSDELPVDSPQWQLVDELVPAEGEAIVEKRYGDSFEDTTLESVLAGLRVGELVVTGGQTDACVRSTIHGGFTRGYDVTLVGDAHSTEDLRSWFPDLPTPAQIIAHLNLAWSHQSAPGRAGRVIDADDVTFGTLAPTADKA